MNHTDQARFMWKWAKTRGTEGVHTFELREQKILNPSQRAKDVADHVPFWTKRDGRGSRYYVDGQQPADATAVRPNGAEGTDCAPVDGAGIPAKDSAKTVGSLSIEAADEQVAVREPVAIVKDFTRPGSKWREVPVSQLDHAFEEAA